MSHLSVPACEAPSELKTIIHNLNSLYSDISSLVTEIQNKADKLNYYRDPEDLCVTSKESVEPISIVDELNVVVSNYKYIKTRLHAIENQLHLTI